MGAMQGAQEGGSESRLCLDKDRVRTKLGEVLKLNEILEDREQMYMPLLLLVYNLGSELCDLGGQQPRS